MCERNLNTNGVMAVFTTESKTFINQIDKTKWIIKKELELKLISNVNSYLYPRIIICNKIQKE
ncbi:MAG: hypothetical protein QG614_424 [Patescibacteria group bacterium]|nr:hypothetical protein [Patescibacteria group bacterium]